MSKEKTKKRWLFFGRDKYTYDTIEELVKKGVGLKIGEVVTLNGYYTAGDGAGHKRIIKAEDDGSGVQLANGLWANVISSGDICYSIFGAKLNGIDDDYFYINKCHNYANKNEVNVKLRKSGIVYFVGNIEVKTSIDFNNSIILCKDENRRSSFNFINDEEFIKKEIIATPFIDTENYFEFFKDLPNNTIIKIDDTEPYSIRSDGGNISNAYRGDLLLHTLRGITSTTTIGGYTDVANTEFYIRHIDKAQYIKNFIYKCETSKNTYGVFSFNINRDNFTIDNVIIDPTLDSMITTVYKERVFYIKDCYNITVKNIIGNNIAGLNADYNFSGHSGYILNFNNVNSLLIENVHLSGGWGCIGSNKINETIIKNSKLNRIDCHIYCKNIKIYNCVLYNWGIMLGDARGEVLVENCTYIINNLRTYNGIIFNMYGSYGCFAPANFKFKNIKVYIKGSRTSILYLASRAGANFRGDKKIGDIEIDGLEIISDKVISSIPIFLLSLEEKYEIGKIKINNLKYISCRNIYLGYFNETLKNDKLEIFIKNSRFTGLFEKPAIEEYFGVNQDGYIPNNILRSFLGNNKENSAKLDLEIENSKIVLIHNWFDRLCIKDSEILLDLDTGNNQYTYKTKLNVYNSYIKMQLYRNSDSDTVISGNQVNFYNCFFGKILFSNKVLNTVNLSKVEKDGFINCGLDEETLETCTGPGVDYFKHYKNLVTKPMGMSSQINNLILEDKDL